MVRLFALPLCLVVKLRPLRWLPWFISAALLACGLSAAPVEFAFYPPETPAEENTFAREFWAEIHSPSGDVRLLPAFYAGDGRWAVRTRADQAGTFRIGRITESTANGITDIAARLAGPHEISVERPDALPAVTIDPRQPRRFVTTDGDGFFPFGANFAWAMGEPDDYYPPTLAAARDAGLNWARVWMAHWGRLNLDWRAPEDGPSPALGTLDLSIAARWDRLIAVAERTEVRLQVVLQHHGQYSSLVNSNWAINPWNVANGGFLATPTDFFTSAQARRLIRQKYRYIVARWGYSPAIFAWELFNEVKWTDARTGPTATIASNLAVAAWHAEMARYIRSLDTHRHLVTTSDDALDHALYAAMDFFQPHLYANNLLASVRHFDRDPATLDRPIFYGEVGDDNMTSLPVALRDNGYSNVPLAWAGAMGQSPYPAQIWYVQRLLDHGGLGPLASLGRFLRASGVTQRSDLQAFVAATQGGDRMPYTIEPGTHWHRMASPTIDVPLDGRPVSQLALVPRTLGWNDPARPDPEPFPSAVTFHFDYPRQAIATLRFATASPLGGAVRVTLDGTVVGERTWPPPPPQAKEPPPRPPWELVLPLTAGTHTLTLTNPSGPEWVEFGSLATGLDMPVIAATGRRSDDLIVLWLYHRRGVFSERTDVATASQVLLEDVPAGHWRLTWWNVDAGEAASSHELEHPGGTLAVDTPPIQRFTAAWLQRQ